MASPLLKKSFVLSSFLILAACGQNSGNDTPSAPAVPPGTVPDRLVFKAPSPGTPLTRAEADKIKSIFREGKNLPAFSLVNPPTNESDFDKKQREQKLGALNPSVRSKLEYIRLNCFLTAPTETKNPRDLEPTPGSKQETKQASAISGANCPISHGENKRTEVTLIDFNRQNSDFALAINGTSDQGTNILDYGFQREFGVISATSRTNFTGAFNSKARVQRTYFSGDITGTSETLRYGKINFNARGEMLLQPSTGSSQTPQMTIAATGNLQLSDLNVRLDVYIATGRSGEADVMEIYLNGNKMSEQDLRDLFGDSPRHAIPRWASTMVGGLQN